MALTLKKTTRLIRQGKAGKYPDGAPAGVRGLHLVVVGKSAASWQLRYQRNLGQHWMGLGSAFDFTLLEARERAVKARQLLADGIDPLTQKRAQRAAQAAGDATTKTFRECAEAYIRDKQAEWKSAAHGIQWRDSLKNYVYPKIGDVDVAKIGKPHVLAVLEQQVKATLGYPAGKFWTVRSVTASRVRNRMELVISSAKARGYRSAAENPAAWSELRFILAAPAKVAKVQNLAAVPYTETPTLMAKLRAAKGVAAQALQFEIMTATRPSEVTGAVWDELDFGEKMWTIPAVRMKGGKEHKVPLSDAAVELLQGLYREKGNEHLFIGAQQPALSLAALRRQLQRLGYNATPHGTARSGFSDWAHERTSHSSHTIELSLGHSVGNAVERSYRRGDMFNKRRQLTTAWSAYLLTPAPAKTIATITPIGAGR
jgi:integrase